MIVIERSNSPLISKVIGYFIIIVKCANSSTLIISELCNRSIIFYLCNRARVANIAYILIIFNFANIPLGFIGNPSSDTPIICNRSDTPAILIGDTILEVSGVIYCAYISLIFKGISYIPGIGYLCDSCTIFIVKRCNRIVGGVIDFCNCAAILVINRSNSGIIFNSAYITGIFNL